MIKLDYYTPKGRRFLNELGNLRKMEVLVGFLQGENSDDNGVDIAEIATANEYGTAHIPPRPFMRMSISDINDRLPAFWKGELKRVMDGGTAENAMNRLGVMAKGVIQNKITTGGFAANAESTIAKKGSSKPLIETGRMRASVNYLVRKKGGD